MYVLYDSQVSMNSVFFFFSSRRRHTRFDCDWSSDVCSSDLVMVIRQQFVDGRARLPERTGLKAAGGKPLEHAGLGRGRRRAHLAPGIGEEMQIGRASCRERV